MSSIIPRQLASVVRERLKSYQVVTITGPRQSGKTTLLRELFPDFSYFTLENLENRALAQQDPLAILRSNNYKVVLDEVQRVPELLSYIQGIVDENREAVYILSGSHNMLMLESVSQTLAGRTSILYLQPLSLEELDSSANPRYTADELIFQGGYPRIYDRGLPATVFYEDYLATYVDRDVRQIRNIGNLSLFQRFVTLCASFSGQMLNVTTLAKSIGVDRRTVNTWLSVLETSFLIYFLPPYFRSFKKRVVKSPKLYFRDTGLACSLLGLRDPQALRNFYNYGSLFENFIVNEISKGFYNRGQKPPIYYYRDSNQHEIDVLLNLGDRIRPIEIKAGTTISTSYFKNLNWLSAQSGVPLDQPTVIY
ncbi:MAG: ATP-binding protein, partial [Bacteroidota bacterium]